ncbi:hypothetical protein AB0C74_23670 [Spirillospora sp. NPDC048832]
MSSRLVPAVIQTGDAMAKWWEIVIPVGGTLAGTGIGAYLQGFFNQRINKQQAETTKEVTNLQLKHDREMNFLDEKRRVYVEFLSELARYEELVRVAEDADEKAEPYRNIETDSLTPQERQGVVDAFQKAYDTSRAVSDKIKEVINVTNALRMIAPDDVMDAAHKLANAVRDQLSVEDITSREAHFITLARMDVGAHFSEHNRRPRS